MKRTAILIALLLLACSGNQRTRATTSAVIIKSTADGLGNGYLDFCEEVRRPACMEADRKAKDAGTPQTKEQRVACLQPCDSATAAKIRTAIDALRTAQTALFHVLVGRGTDEDLAASRAQLLSAAQELAALLESTGATKMLQDAVGG